MIDAVTAAYSEMPEPVIRQNPEAIFEDGGRQGRTGNTKLTFTPLVLTRESCLRARQYQPAQSEIEKIILTMRARGCRLPQIQNAIFQRCGIQIPLKMVAAVRKEQLRVSAEWRARSLDRVYVIVYFSTLRVKVREPGARLRHISLAVGVRCDGGVDILGAWIRPQTDSDFWARCLGELRSRGIGDVLVAMVRHDEESVAAFASAFPAALVLSPDTENWAEPGARQIQSAAMLYRLDTPIRQLLHLTDPFKVLMAKVRRGGLKAHSQFNSAADALDLLLVILQPAALRWRVKPGDWGPIEAHLRRHFASRLLGR